MYTRSDPVAYRRAKARRLPQTVGALSQPLVAAEPVIGVSVAPAGEVRARWQRPGAWQRAKTIVAAPPGPGPMSASKGWAAGAMPASGWGACVPVCVASW